MGLLPAELWCRDSPRGAGSCSSKHDRSTGQNSSKGRAPVPASKSIPNSPGARQIRKKLCERNVAGTGEGLATRRGMMADTGASWGGLDRAVHGGCVGGVGNRRRMIWHWRRKGKALCRAGNSQGREEAVYEGGRETGEVIESGFPCSSSSMTTKITVFFFWFLRDNTVRRYILWGFCVCVCTHTREKQSHWHSRQVRFIVGLWGRKVVPQSPDW